VEGQYKPSTAGSVTFGSLRYYALLVETVDSGNNSGKFYF